MDEKEPTGVLYRLKRGLSGYVSYLAACDMNEAFSEYILYEPILRILTARGYVVECEYPCPEKATRIRGDKKRIDFHVTGHDLKFAIEVKWVKKRQPDIKTDYNKLHSYLRQIHGSRAFLCVFGRKKYLESIILRSGDFHEKGKPIYADFRKTRYGCRIFELKER